MKLSLPNQAHSLVADIGGTNTRVALAEGPTVLTETICQYRSAEHQDFADVLEHYLTATGSIECQMACVAVAGLVADGVGKLTNLDWCIDNDSLARSTGASTVVILNDLQAQGYSLGYITAAQLREIIPKPPASARATQLVIGVGTGFNATVVYHLESGSFAAPAEAGQANMPSVNDADLSLANFIAADRDFTGVEDVLSGRGLEHIYAWLGDGQESLCVPAGDIIQALDTRDPRAESTLRIFVRLLGMVTGNLALTALPYGGIYLVGGVSRAIAPYLREFGFTEAFRSKGRFSGFMERFGVAVIEDDYAALTGCARHLAAGS